MGGGYAMPYGIMNQAMMGYGHPYGMMGMMGGGGLPMSGYNYPDNQEDQSSNEKKRSLKKLLKV